MHYLYQTGRIGKKFVMGKRKFQDYLPDQCHRRYSCVHCRAHLANHDELISKVKTHLTLL